ncbi:sensor histidine kinase [Phytoactinopolyspora halotolerans]|uniref:histidine kinase n=1 Tax=Phytoactinopolyspora halotolerans TaxID=1981512 RepID=A0A6L9S3U8_9ACTN|nr:HAMP domain-containing sensor histidine kinase [Phytoactinopolyspora halotolerans]NED99708.1 HAMP domain-containing histidine kinase [Phytoactinopolyspora halotolerans]
MRRRLLVVYLLMAAAVLLAVAVPYAVSIATRETQAVFIDQLNDTARFASMADPALRSNETVTLQDEISRYDELFDVGAAVLDINGEVIAASRDDLPLADDEVRRRMNAGLAGERSGIEQVVWPWTTRPLVLVEPVGRGGEVIGVALTVAPTDELSGHIRNQWIVLGGVGCAAMAAASLVALGLARWTLRPVHDLDTVAHDISAGALDARVPEDEGPSELRRLAASFNAMADTVTGTLNRQKAFVSQASHQMRTPLGVLRLRLENLAEHVRPSGQREHSLTVAEINRLAQILSGLLTLARAEGTPLQLTEVDVDRLVDDRIAGWQPMASESGVLLARGARLGHRVLATDDVVGQCLDALLDNALKFTPSGGHVVVDLRRDGDTAEIHVIDEGPGLSEDEREQAGTRFWRSPDHQNTPGSGLGLAIVRELADACEGDLTLLPADTGGIDARLRLRLVVNGTTADDARAPAWHAERT